MLNKIHTTSSKQLENDNKQTKSDYTCFYSYLFIKDEASTHKNCVRLVPLFIRFQVDVQ